MIVRLFDIQNSKVVITEHCYTLPFLKKIMDEYPDTHMQVYQYIFYMSCPNPDLNPFFNLPEHEKEDIIIEEIQLQESKARETAVGKITAKYEQIRQSYKGAYTDMLQEQESSVRGGAGLAYDQI